jgi:FkbM family methyltransferase
MELPPGDIGPWVSMLSKTLYEINSTRAPFDNWRESTLLDEKHFRFFQYAINFMSCSDGVLGFASQNFQDVWASYRNACRNAGDPLNNIPGFFVEFGAFDGVYSSNTLRLQKAGDYWNGILAEPNPQWTESLLKARSRAGVSIETDHCIAGRTGDVTEFTVTADPIFSGMGVGDPDGNGRTILLPTISLNDLLTRYDAPTYIDFMSIDTEGSEYDILQAFDFKKWNVRDICVEHNFRPVRDDIYRLMTANGYRREFEGFSRWDDFYTKDSE